jgi:cytosine/adenosine deaminase-related metal-dependent hydrolase
MSILLKNVRFINPKTFEIKSTHLLITSGNNGTCTEFPLSTIELPAADFIIDGKNQIALPSFVCGHHHAYSSLATGMPAPKKNPENFQEILKYIWWTLDKCLDTEMIEISAFNTAIACAKNGVTMVVDHHSSPAYIKGSLEIMHRAFSQVGVSDLLCYEISDRDGETACNEALEETDSYLASYQGLVGLHASFTLSDDTISKAAQIMEKHKSGVHIHVAEDTIDENLCQEKHGKSVVQRLYDFGLLNSSRSIFSHCLHINDSERTLIAESPVWIAQNIESNMNNQVGFFNSKGIGKNVMLGTDGMHSDMIRSAQQTFFAGKNFDTIDFMETWRRFQNAGMYINSNGFQGYGPNNIVVLDYEPHTELTSENFLGHFIFSMSSKHVNHVISNGKLIVEHKKMLTVNETEIAEESRRLSKMLWKKMQE